MWKHHQVCYSTGGPTGCLPPEIEKKRKISKQTISAVNHYKLKVILKNVFSKRKKNMEIWMYFNYIQHLILANYITNKTKKCCRKIIKNK